MSDLVVELNKAAVESARRAIDQYRANGGTEAKYIAGSVGPTNKTASLSPDVNNPGFRAVSFDDLRECYFEQCEALVKAGVDALLIETVFDTLNAKAALFAAQDAIEASGREVAIMLSGTITDASGRTLSGQTTEAFLISVGHAPLLSIGLNCALGAKQLMPYLQTGRVKRCASGRVCVCVCVFRKMDKERDKERARAREREREREREKERETRERQRERQRESAETC